MIDNDWTCTQLLLAVVLESRTRYPTCLFHNAPASSALLTLTFRAVSCACFQQHDFNRRLKVTAIPDPGGSEILGSQNYTSTEQIPQMTDVAGVEAASVEQGWTQVWASTLSAGTIQERRRRGDKSLDFTRDTDELLIPACIARQ